MESVKLWDMPGFGDNRGITQILINIYYIHRIFALHGFVKIAFTLNYLDLLCNEKGGKLIETIK